MERALGDEALRIDAGSGGADAVHVATGIVYGMQAVGGLGPNATVLVDGADQRVAAAFVNRLGDAGLSNVWLLTR